MPDADVESDPIFPLLTDALRAGPGSPEWHQAVGKLRAAGLADGDEYKLLVSVREHLASGRDYKSIRAGPGFTRKVMAAVEAERQRPAGGRRRTGPSLASVIALSSLVVVLGVVAFVAYQFSLRGSATQATVDELAEAYFPRVEASAAFDAGGIPKDWRVVGALPLEAGKGGLRPVVPPAAGPATAPPVASPSVAPPPATAVGDTAGGAVVAPLTVPADEPFAVEVKLRPGRAADDLIVQVFVSSEGDFSPDKSTSSKELAWLVQGGRQKVVLGGEADSRVLFDAPKPDGGGGTGGGAAKAEPVTVRVNVNREFAVAFAGGPRVWAGPHGLAAKPRFVGVRFLRVDPSKPVADPPAVLSIRVLRK
jgi:hypothetical protein